MPETAMTVAPVCDLPAPADAVFPLSCEWCKNAPATCVLVYDHAHAGFLTPFGMPDRVKAFICSRCADRDMGRAREIAKTSASAWLFNLTPVGEVAHA